MNTSETNLHSTQSNPNERTNNGQFAKGNKGGPGNPFGRQVAQLRKTLLACVTEEEMIQIGKVLIDLAKSGNIQATKLLFSYTLGKPTEGVAPDRVDVEEWQIFKEVAKMKDDLEDVVTSTDAQLPLQMARAAQHAMSQDMARQYVSLEVAERQTSAEEVGDLRSDKVARSGDRPQQMTKEVGDLRSGEVARSGDRPQQSDGDRPQQSDEDQPQQGPLSSRLEGVDVGAILQQRCKLGLPLTNGKKRDTGSQQETSPLPNGKLKLPEEPQLPSVLGTVW